MRKTYKRLMDSSSTEYIIYHFAEEVLKKTIRNRDVQDQKNRDCMKHDLRQLYSKHGRDADAVSHAVATELQRILFDLRDESFETERADVY